MGGVDKLGLTVDGLPLLRARAIAAIATGQPVSIALPAPDHPRAALVRDLAVTIVFPVDAALGLAHSLRAAVARLPACDRMLILLADMPDITTADILTVLAAPEAQPDALIWRGASAAGVPGHPVLFDARLRPGFATLVGDTGAEPIIRANRDRTVLVPLPYNHACHDLDTPDDWAAFRNETGR